MRAGKLARLEKLLEEGADPNQECRPRRNGPTYLPLLEAVNRNRHDFVAAFLKHNVDVNKQDTAGWTALHVAVTLGQEDLVKLLLENGADPNLANAKGDIPLMTAAGGYLGMVEHLLEHKADPFQPDSTGDSFLHFAIGFGATTLIEAFLQKGFDMEMRGRYGRTPLMKAAHSQKDDLVVLLLKHGADPNVSDDYGLTPLMFACIGKCPSIVQMLLEKGVEVNNADEDGDTALHHAASDDNMDVMNLLLSNGADVSIKNKEGRTALLEACEREQKAVVFALLETHAAGFSKYSDIPRDILGKEECTTVDGSNNKRKRKRNKTSK